MNPDQLKNLEEILTNEKQQLAAIDEKYKNDGGTATAQSAAAMEEKMKVNKQKREKTEKEEAEKEEATEEELLGKIQAM